MPGSPEYIELIRTLPRTITGHTELTEAWQDLKRHEPNDALLLAMATSALNRAFDMQTQPDTWRRFLERQVVLHLRKNAGYAGFSEDPWANFREAENFAITAFHGVLVRMSDKYSRYISLTANPRNNQVNESISDTLIDLGAYALIAVCLRREEIAA